MPRVSFVSQKLPSPYLLSIIPDSATACDHCYAVVVHPRIVSIIFNPNWDKMAALHHPTRPVLQRLGQMRRLHLRLARQVCDGARRLEHPVIPERALNSICRTAARMSSFPRSSSRQKVCIVYRGAAARKRRGRPHVAVDVHAGLAQPGEALGLHSPRRLHPRPDGGRRLAAVQARQLVATFMDSADSPWLLSKLVVTLGDVQPHR